MPHLHKTPIKDLTGQLQSTAQNSLAIGQDVTFFQVFGSNPALYDWYIQRFYEELFYAKHIDIQLKELLRIKLSSLHGCQFCNQGNRLKALEAGITKEQLNNLHKLGSACFSEKEKAILKLAEEMALTKPTGVMDKSLYTDLSQCFSDGELLELGMIMGILSGIAKFLFVFDLVEKEVNCPFHQQGNNE